MALTLIVLRHGRAGDGWSLNDRSRSLTTEGHVQAELAARRLEAWGLRPEAVICSDAKRALQTATRVAETLALSAVPQPWAPLYDDFSAGDLLEHLCEVASTASPVLVVGHNPLLTYRADELLSGGLHGTFPTGGLLAMRFEAEAWEGNLVGQGVLVNSSFL